MAKAARRAVASPQANSTAVLERQRIYRNLKRIRIFEERLADLFQAGKVYGTAHPCIGQEAVSVGALLKLTPQDYVTGTHRSHGHCIAKGADITLMMMELLGRAGGYCGGKGGSMHIAALNLGMLGCNGIVAAGLPHAAGAAMAAQLRGENRVGVGFLGDGASNQGVLYETLNLAAVWKLPLVVVCENNHYALSTRYADTHSTPDIGSKASGFGLPVEIVDGMDVDSVAAAVDRAVERARAGEGPSFIECKTYRYWGHSLRNDRPKRAPEEIAAWRARDPLERNRRLLVEEYGVSEADVQAIDEEEMASLAVAVETAEAAPQPTAEALTAGVYCDDTYEMTPPPRTESEETRQTSFAAALNEGLAEEMARDSEIIVFGEDVGDAGGVFGVTTGLQQRFGWKRCRDTPISEQALTGLGIGLALGGARPVVEIQFMDIMTLTVDQLVNQAAKIRYMLGGGPKVPLVVRAPLGAGTRLAAQHSQSLEAWFMHVPGLKVVMPSTPYDAKGLLVSAIRDPNPIIFLEHKLLYFLSGPVPQEHYSLPIGVGEVKRAGKDVTVVATGGMVRKALQVARQLGRSGVSVEVVDPRTLQPLDMDIILTSVAKTGRLVVVHEACLFGGAGGEIVSQVVEKAFSSLKAPPVRVGAPFCPVPYNDALEQAFIPDEKQIAEAIAKTLR
jgi:2-oxoisovalerate dehydrogenase E1 component